MPLWRKIVAEKMESVGGEKTNPGWRSKVNSVNPEKSLVTVAGGEGVVLPVVLSQELTPKRLQRNKNTTSISTIGNRE